LTLSLEDGLTDGANPCNTLRIRMSEGRSTRGNGQYYFLEEKLQVRNFKQLWYFHLFHVMKVVQKRGNYA
jgi:hypothetical protein